MYCVRTNSHVRTGIYIIRKVLRMLYILIALLVILDQGLKYFITQNFQLFEIQPVIQGFFSLTYFRNSGGAFSFLAETDWGIFILSGVSILVSAGLIYLIVRLRNKDFTWMRVALSLLAAGSIGNMIDRIRFRSVVDFLMFTFGSYTFPIFNVADMCIVVGSILLAFLAITDKRILGGSENPIKRSKEKASEEKNAN